LTDLHVRSKDNLVKTCHLFHYQCVAKIVSKILKYRFEWLIAFKSVRLKWLIIDLWITFFKDLKQRYIRHISRNGRCYFDKLMTVSYIAENGSMDGKLSYIAKDLGNLDQNKYRVLSCWNHYSMPSLIILKFLISQEI
jgi:hypothetical protein